MRHIETEERAVLLLTPTDDDDDDDDGNNNNNNFELPNCSTVRENDRLRAIAKHPKSYDHNRTSNIHPILCFTFVMGAFIVGCISGIVVMFYRISQDNPQSSLLTTVPATQTMSINSDSSTQTKLFQSVTSKNFLDVKNSIVSENEAANKLYDHLKTFSSTLINVNKLTYDINLSKFVSSTQWNGIKIINNATNEKEFIKLNRSLDESFLSFSSLVKSGMIDGNSIYYVNYGRPEDFAFLTNNGNRLINNDKSIVMMRRKQIIIPQTEQIHQAIYYGFAALILFDDYENQQVTTTNHHESFFREWARYPSPKDRENFLDGNLSNKDRSIVVLTLSYKDVQRLFESLRPDSDQWLSCPTEWHNKSTSLKIGGTLSTRKLQIVVDVEQTNIKLPVVMSSIRGTVDTENFIMVGYKLGALQQEKIINEIIAAFYAQIKNGWKPRRSILFCAWSGLDYDLYTIRRWISDNNYLIERNLIAYLDLGNGILANSILNLRGSPLFEQIAHQTAGLVASPFGHNKTCYRQQTTTKSVISNEENSHHDHGKRRRRRNEHDLRIKANQQEEIVCEKNTLLDEWVQKIYNLFQTNYNLNIIQPIDVESPASLFQSQYGIPSLLIEMTDEQAFKINKIYVDHPSPVFDREIQPNVYVAYTQFVIEIIRQLIDEPLILFNLTKYADQIDKQVIQYLEHYKNEYLGFSYHIGQSDEFSELLNNLTKSIRHVQAHIDETSRNDYVRLQLLNQRLMNFERLFIMDKRLPGMNTDDKIYKHILIGPAFSFSDTVVPFPLLSNILVNLPMDPPSELCDGAKVFSLKLKDHIHSIIQSLKGFDGLMTNYE